MSTADQLDRTSPRLVSPDYWLRLCRGFEAAEAFLGISVLRIRSLSDPDVVDVGVSLAFMSGPGEALIGRFPILGLPEFPGALRAWSQKQTDPLTARAWAAGAACLEQLHDRLSKHDPLAFGLVLKSCAGAIREEERGDPVVNWGRAAELFAQARTFFGPATPDFLTCLDTEGRIHEVLAILDVEAWQAHFEEALRLYAHARSACPPGSADSALWLMRETKIRFALGRLGVQRVKNLEEGVRRYNEAGTVLGPGSPHFAHCLHGEATARAELAESVIDDRASLTEAVRVAKLARTHLRPDDVLFGASLHNEALVRSLLAQRGADAEANLVEAVELCGRARPLFPEGSRELGLCLLNEGQVRLLLATLGVNSQPNLEGAIRLFIQARPADKERSPDYGTCLASEARARRDLASKGVNVRPNLEEAVRLNREARGAMKADSLAFALCLAEEALSRLRLAELGVDAPANVGEARRLHALGAPSREPDSPQLVAWLQSQATVCLGLASAAVETPANLERAAQLSSRVQTLCPGSPGAAHSMIDEGMALYGLAALDVNKEGNLEQALRLFAKARDLLPPGPARDRCLLAEGIALRLRDGPPRETATMLRMFQPTITEDSPPQLLSFLRNMWRSDGRGKGLDAMREAGDRMRDSGNHLGAMDAYATLGWEALEHADPEGARDAYAQAIRMLEQVRATARSPRDRQAWMENNIHLFKEMVGACVLLGHREEAMEYAERGRGRAFLDLLSADDVAPESRAVAAPLNLGEIKELARTLGHTLGLLWVGTLRAMAFLVRPSGEFTCLPLPGVVDEVVAEWLHGPRDGPRGLGWMGTYDRYRRKQATLDEWQDQIGRTLAVVREKVMGPVFRHLSAAGETRVALIVGGPLALLPLHAARDPDGTEDHIEVVYAPSAGVLRRCADRPPVGWTPILGVANPESTGQESLEYGRWEVEQIGTMVGGRHPPGTLTSLVGPDATPERVAAALADHPVAHFSCHGVWDFRQPLQSALALAGGVLSLADLFGRARPRGAGLVVLSACESGPSFRPDTGGEEYLGLPAGFIAAGARAVVGSLWSVPQAPTALLMAKMYEHLLAARGVAESLQRAQTWLRGLDQAGARAAAGLLPRRLGKPFLKKALHLGEKPFAHPYFWAAFAVWGAPGRIVEET